MSVFSSETARRWRAPGLVTIGALLAAAALWLGSQGGGPQAVRVPRPAAPVLQVDRETVDFGRVPLGRWVETTFVLTNAGGGPLRFSDAPWVEIAAGC